ncbi:Uncharacterized membrane protein, DUF485 family [Jatrophihabitans endophyticus]|uniref:Uncharacterized membrane protein, DUF485 family n=1 Tax=Jatrophihabitans endophyticus TaxID=1206085 RepID=A0A1M5TXX2_9ACTN|nr:DUF485 domain-containing protein [Jatrophihabitans endophyticus]SHH55476.1 Uncharacterized membrane protein, DUF485 family [Jatrophihabitans endophyticus]
MSSSLGKREPERPPVDRDAPTETYVDVANSPEFDALRRTFRRFVFPMSALFLTWYLVYVLLSNYAGDFMGTTVVGNIHLGLVIGLLQFVSTFVITMVYARWAGRRFDPAAEDLARRVHLPEQHA